MKVTQEGENGSENAANNYIERKIVQYILNRAFPGTKIFKNFYHPEDFYYKNIYSLRNIYKERGYAEEIYEGVRYPRDKKRSRNKADSFQGRLEDTFYNLATRKFFFNNLYKILADPSNDWTLKKGLLSVVPLAVGAVLAISLPIYLPLILGGVSLVMLLKVFYSAYIVSREQKEEFVTKVSSHFTIEKTLLEEKEHCKQFEGEIELTKLINSLLKQGNILLLKDHLEDDLRGKLQELFKVLVQDDRISRVSKKVIDEICNLNSEDKDQWERKLQKVASALKRSPNNDKGQDNSKESQPKKQREHIEEYSKLSQELQGNISMIHHSLKIESVLKEGNLKKDGDNITVEKKYTVSKVEEGHTPSKQNLPIHNDRGKNKLIE